MSPHAPRWLAAGALVLGALAPFAGEPFPRADAAARSTPVGTPGSEIPAGTEISAIELAARIRNRAPGLRVLDLRSPEAYAEGHVPMAENADPAGGALPASASLVVYAAADSAAEELAASLRRSGHADVRVLHGGYAAWVEGVLFLGLDPELTPAERERLAALSRYFGGQPRLGAPRSKPGSDPASPRAARPRLQGRGC